MPAKTKTPAKKPNPRGRPTTYTKERGDQICELISEGRTTLAVSRMLGMKRHTIIKWARKYPDFGAMYAQARQHLYEHWADEILDDAENETRDNVSRRVIKTGYSQKLGDYNETIEQITSDNTAVQRDRLKVDSKKWLLSKLLPKEYGDKIETQLTGKDGESLTPVLNITITKRDG